MWRRPREASKHSGRKKRGGSGTPVAQKPVPLPKIPAATHRQVIAATLHLCLCSPYYVRETWVHRVSDVRSGRLLQGQPRRLHKQRHAKVISTKR